MTSLRFRLPTTFAVELGNIGEELDHFGGSDVQEQDVEEVDTLTGAFADRILEEQTQGNPGRDLRDPEHRTQGDADSNVSCIALPTNSRGGFLVSAMNQMTWSPGLALRALIQSCICRI